MINEDDKPDGETPEEEEEEVNPQLQKIRHAAGNLYDLQKLRIQAGNRASSLTVELDDKDKKFMDAMSTGLDAVERVAERQLLRHLKGFPIYEVWLKHQPGCGTKMSGVMVASIKIHKCDTVSKLWAYCGLSVVNGHGQRRIKGQKANYNPWLKSKLVKVLGDNLIRYAKVDENGQYFRSTAKVPTPIARSDSWRPFYDDYKHRKQSMRVPVCMLCEGKGTYEKKPCNNCGGTGGPAPWGKSDGHRHNAARRYLVKMFLQELWIQWRTLEGLPVTPSYAEAYLGVKHGEHTGSLGATPKPAPATSVEKPGISQRPKTQKTPAQVDAQPPMET